jgi:TRAP-type C4-dicarboxylate transport system substrate-binding protein
MTEHEANNNLIWISDKLWKSLTDEQKKWVQTAADEVSNKEPAKSGFQKLADPYLDKLAAELGPHAVKIKDLIKAVK